MHAVARPTPVQMQVLPEPVVAAVPVPTVIHCNDHTQLSIEFNFIFRFIYILYT